MVAAQAYGKVFRSVKTCVGQSFCRFGTQKTMELGIKIEENFEYIDTPHKFKVGVSGCPRAVWNQQSRTLESSVLKMASKS